MHRPMIRSLCLTLAISVLTGCTYNRQTHRFESVPPMGSNTVDGIREASRAIQSREVKVPTDPPAAREQTERGDAPEGMGDPVYIEGHYVWRRGEWQWFRGGWVDRPGDASIYVAPTMVVRDGQRYWRAGRWE